MFKTIIVGVDGRDGGRDALALAASLQRVFAGDLIAVHAFPVDYYVGRAATARTRTPCTTLRSRPSRTRSSGQA